MTTTTTWAWWIEQINTGLTILVCVKYNMVDGMLCGYFMFNVVLYNSYLLSSVKSQEEFRVLLYKQCRGIEWMSRRGARSSGQWGRWVYSCTGVGGAAGSRNTNKPQKDIQSKECSVEARKSSLY
jgi:hypothetical protein